MKKLYHYPAMLILSLFAVLALLLLEITAYISQVMFKPQIYSEALGRYDVAGAIYDDLNTYFEQFSAPTGIPKECFTDSLDKTKLSEAAYALLTDSLAYLTDPNAPTPTVKYDFTQLENDITEYVEQYSEENGIEKNDEYYKLIEQTISTAETQIESRLDVMMLHTLSQSKFASGMHKYARLIDLAMIISAVLLAALVAAMCFVDRRHPRDYTYWFGTILFCSSAILLIPAAYVNKIGYFDSFFMKSEHIYRTVTGLFNTTLERVIRAQTIVLISGILLIIITAVVHNIYVRYRKRKRLTEV